jgi:hypothetical protein
VHADSRGTYGARRVRADLVLGRGVTVSHGTVEMLMRQARITGITGRPKWRHVKPDNIAADLIQRAFARTGPNQLWVTDITEHPTSEGKVYCCVVLDAYSRRDGLTLILVTHDTAIARRTQQVGVMSEGLLSLHPADRQRAAAGPPPARPAPLPEPQPEAPGGPP